MNDDEHRDDDSGGQGGSSQPQWSGGNAPQSQEVRHSQVSALVPEHVSRGVFSTGAVVLQGAHEFIIDFLQRMTSPRQLAARVVLPPGVVARLIAALRENLANYERNFGRSAAPPAPAPPSQSAPATSETAASGEAPPSDLVQPKQEIVSPGQPASGAGSEGGGTGTQPPAEQTPQSQSQQLPQNTAQDLYEQLKLPDDVLSGRYANAVMIGHTQTEFCFDFITTFFPRSAVACRVYLAAPNAARFLDALTHSFEQYQRKLRTHRAGQQPLPPKPPPPPPEPS